MFAKRASSLAQTGLRTTVRAAQKQREAGQRGRADGASPESSLAPPVIQEAAIRQKPDGRQVGQPLREDRPRREEQVRRRQGREAEPEESESGRRACAKARERRRRERGEENRRRPEESVPRAERPHDQADSSAESRRGSAIRPRQRKNTAHALAARASAGSGASGFSTSKMPVAAARIAPPRTAGAQPEDAERTAADPA